ncbi:hypothetical protein EUBDOL_01283 [Amedibacillus dolichus DSM 3991]|uniref:Uncharacterized protein n=1 Tax=Amedibacillus dolichus DSM 3991 TaxID=428127 RepID=A8RC62_9FIRM|nr:hypothetical protein EUBDOL_01283 [Amedibacillus dolichus DSM 3991]
MNQTAPDKTDTAISVLFYRGFFDKNALFSVFYNRKDFTLYMEIITNFVYNKRW